MNLANVRSAIGAMLVATALASAGDARAATDPAAPGREAEEAAGRVVIAVLPYQTSVGQIAAVPNLAPGLISAGLGSVPVAQTFLDISQGNRVNQNLYDGELPRLYVQEGRVPARLWDQVVNRADSAPANIVPGLLATTLANAGVSVSAEADSGLATLIGVDRDGAVPIAADAGSARG